MATTAHFGPDDLAMFSEASHDRSLLHVSEEFARRTPYGETLVFGILGAFAILGSLRDRPDQQLASVLLIYRAPLYKSVHYTVDATQDSTDRARAVITDQGKVMMSASFIFRAATEPLPEFEGNGLTPLSEQALWRPEELCPGVRVSGRYAPSSVPLRRLVERWNVARKGATNAQINCLLWSSYLTGMQLPGVRGTSAQLRMTFRGQGPAPETPFDYIARIVEFDPRFGILRSAANLSGKQGPFCDAEVWSHVRVV